MSQVLWKTPHKRFVRITIGTDNEMEELLTATQEILKEYRQEDPQYEKKENT